MSKPRPLYVNAKPPAPQSLNALQAVLVAHAAEQQLKLIPRSNSLVHNDTSVALPIDPKDLRLTAQVVSQPGSVARTLALGTALIPVDVAGRVAVESLIDLNEAALLPQVFAWVKKAKDDVDASSPLGVSLSKLESMLSAAYLTGSAATVADYVTFASVFPLFALNGGLATKAGYPQLRQWFTRMNDLASVQKGLKSLGVSTPQNLTFEKFVPRPPATKEEKRKQMEKARADRKKQLAAAAEKKKAKKQAALAAAAAAEEKARQDRIKLLDTSWQPRVPLGHISRTWGKPRPGKAGAVVDKLGEKKNTGYVPPKSTVPSKAPTLPAKDKRNVLITSALPYVNNVPHLGNIIGCVLSADVYARFCRLRGYNTLYVCGTDEYGTATETKALAADMTPQQICDKYHVIHKGIYEWFDISFNKFGRTTTPWQTKIAQDIFHKCDDNGWVNEADVEQLYCEDCKRFLADRYVEGTCPECSYDDARGDQCDKCGNMLNAIDLINPRCKVCERSPKSRISRHLFLDLPTLTPQLKSFVDAATKRGTWTSNSVCVTEAGLRDGLIPRCISRDLKWGTPVPKDGFRNKVFYVWFDAPIGYISITANLLGEDWKKWWQNPEDVELVQFMGKDNIPFHCTIFPATLMATQENYTMLHRISTTEYLNYEGGKFSKSRGTGVFGNDAQKTGISSEVWRYYLLWNRPEASDTVFLWEDFAAKNNNELLNNLGNFVNRAMMFVKNNCDGKVPEAGALNDADTIFLGKVNDELAAYIAALENTRIKDGLKHVMAISRLGNQYLQENKPWVLKKTDRARCDTVCNVCINLVRLISIVTNPYMPSFTQKVSYQLNLPFDECNGYLANITPTHATSVDKTAAPSSFQGTNLVAAGHEIGQPEHLFTKIEDSQISQFRSMFGGDELAGEPFPCRVLSGRILSAENHPSNNTMYVVSVDVGNKKKRQVVSSLAKAYPDKADLIGLNVALVCNVRPSKVDGVPSEALMLHAASAGSEQLFTLSESKAGTKIIPKGCPVVDSSTFNHQANWDGLEMKTNAEGELVFGKSNAVLFAGKEAVVAAGCGADALVHL